MFRCMGCMAEIPQNAAQCPHCGYLRGTPPMEAYHLEPETILQGRYIVGRVLGYSYQETDVIAKMVPMELNITLERALQINPAFREAYDNDPRVHRLRHLRQDRR